MPSKTEPEFMQALPEGKWDLVEGDKRSSSLVYRSEEGKEVRVPSIHYNQPVAWRVEYFRFMVKNNFEAAERLRQESGRDADVRRMHEQGLRLQAEATVMQNTKQLMPLQPGKMSGDALTSYRSLVKAGAPVEHIIKELGRRMSDLEALPPETPDLEEALLDTATYQCSLLDPALFEIPALQRTAHEMLRLIAMVGADLNGRLPGEILPQFRSVMSLINADHQAVQKTDGNGLAALMKRDAIRIKHFTRMHEAQITGDAAQKLKALVGRLDWDVTCSLPNIGPPLRPSLSPTP